MLGEANRQICSQNWTGCAALIPTFTIEIKMANPTNDDGAMLKELELRWQKRLLACIKSLPAEERAAFDKWYAEIEETTPTSDWPGLKKYFPDGLK
jgi:hypothetical protein